MIRYFKLILIVGAFFLSCSAMAKEEIKKFPYKEFEPFKMVFLPDIHLSLEEVEKEGSILYKESLVILQDVILNLNKRGEIDFAVFGGNLSDDIADLPMFLDTVADLNADYYAILGNLEAMAKGEFIKEFDEFGTQTFWTAEPVENILVIGMDSSICGQEKGYINIHQLFWLDTILKNNREKFTIIAMHHSPYLSLEKPELFLELLNFYPQVKLVLSGHDLRSFAKQENGKLFMSFPSIVSYPNKYRILEIYPDMVRVDTEKISFKQIIKKAKKKLGKKYRKPDKFSRKSKYYY